MFYNLYRKLNGVVVIFCLLVLIRPSVNTDSMLDEEQRPGGSYVYRNTRPSELGHVPVWDPHGYVFFCLCMGRMGNQIDHLLGGMAFAESLNRTLVLPPFRTYHNVRFTEWFKYEPMEAHQKVVLAEDFMEFIAPSYWPSEQRFGFCWLPTDTEQSDCKMKEGNPFGPFWDDLEVEFNASVIYHISYEDHDQWITNYPASRFPVLAFRGAPASFPVKRRHRRLQQHLVFSDRIVDESNKYIAEHFAGAKFIGLHLRNGQDWLHACKHAVGQSTYMASPQCLESTPSRVVTKELCFPPDHIVLAQLKKVVVKLGATVVFVATDRNPMMDQIETYLAEYNVTVFHADPWLPLIDWSILIQSDHFIGNCVSSFTAFVKRARDIAGKPTSFWGFS